MTYRALPAAVLMLLPFASATCADDLLAELASAELGRRSGDALFRRAARSADPATRAAAARAAGRIRDDDAVAWLLPLLRDDSGPVRRAALFALGQIGSEAIVLPLREALAGLPAIDLPHALEALGKTRDARAVSAVARYLAHEDPEARNQAALALFRLDDPSALAELFAALAAEREPEPRWRQVYAAHRLLRSAARAKNGPVPVDAVWQALLRKSLAADRVFHERVFAAMAIGGTEGGESDLVPLLRDSDPRVVIAAVRGLAAGPATRVPDGLAFLLDHADSLVRETALDAMVTWKDRAGLRAAATKLEGAPAVRAHVALAEAERDAEEGANALEGIELRSGDPISEELACRLAGIRGAPLPPLRALKTAGGRRAAAEACGKEGRIGPDAARAALRALLADADATVRATAAGIVAERGFKDLAPDLVRAARTASGHEAPDARSEAAAALGTLGAMDPWLREAADDPFHPVRDAARAALGKLGQPVPPARPRAGFQLLGTPAAEVVASARALRGARVVLETSRGTMTMILLPDEAPVHCVHFARLVARGFYDGKTWHRVVPDFVIQGGCPRGDGWGGPGYYLPDEIGTRPYVRGTVGMPKAGDDTGGCQLFVTHLPTPHLDGRYTVFAQLVEGEATLDRIRVGDTIRRARLLVPGKPPVAEDPE